MATRRQLRTAALKRGDIILVTSHTLLSQAIKLGTRSDISHALIYVQGHSVIDATDEGVQARNTQRLFYDEDCPLYVLRLRGGLTSDQADAIVTTVRQHVGAQYATPEAILSALGGSNDFSRKQFCSRLVAQAYAAAGIQLVKDPNYCSPADLKNSRSLELVNDATELASAEAITFSNATPDLTLIMRQATNAVLEGVRALGADIQTLSDVSVFLAANPQHDELICRLYEESGYLHVWRIDVEQHPEHYDLDALNGCGRPLTDIEKYCQETIANEASGPNRYVRNHAAYASYAATFDLKTYATLKDLYEHLSKLHKRRVDVATAWLVAHGRLGARPHRALTPHTPEWFKALEEWNPPQAAHTRFILDTEERNDVCSICGDEPADVYRLASEHRPPAGVDTLRLCSDCLGIRGDMGEPYERFDAEDG